MKISFICFFFTYRKSKIACVAQIFLLDKDAIDRWCDRVMRRKK